MVHYMDLSIEKEDQDKLIILIPLHFFIILLFYFIFNSRRGFEQRSYFIPFFVGDTFNPYKWI